ncbi:MAG TPA: hypothetical protein VHM90_03725 [Phycisphaerae bacterium]|jgi:hypothetical protein|nr:hypothetical protein [Phycisphaerae bacterium]
MLMADFYESYIERQKIKIVFGIVCLLFVSLFMSCQEMRYMISGKTADANATTRVQMDQRRDGSKFQKRVLGYTYDDNGTQRQHYMDVPMDWDGIQNGAVKVQYIPGRDQSRLLGQTNLFWVCVFGLSVVFAGIGGYMIAREK